MKTKIIAALLIITIFTGNAFTQVTDTEKKLRSQSTDTIQGWKTGGVVALNLAQTSLTNWAAGGQNSVAVNGIFSTFANYKGDRSVWDNSPDIGYGLLKQGHTSVHSLLLSHQELLLSGTRHHETT